MLNHAKMIITCPQCATRYQIDGMRFPDEGREVKCTSCENLWFQDYEGLTPAEMPEDASSSDKKPEFAKPASEKSSEGSPDIGEDSAQEHAEPETAPVSIEQEASRLMKHSKGLRASSEKEKKQRDQTAKKILLLFACLVIVGALGIKNRVGIVKKLPETAIVFEKIGLPVNVRGLEFKNIEAVRDFQNGIPVLAIKGEILNVSQVTRNTASLRYALFNDNGQEVYHWVVPLQIKSLGPNTSMPIAARLAAPPDEARKLEVRFVRGTK